jgi:hypothetical protein
MNEKKVEELAVLPPTRYFKIVFDGPFKVYKDNPDKTEYVAILNNFPGMVVSGNSKREAWQEMITSIKVLLAYNSGISADELKELEDGWVSVEERLPNSKQYVLCYGSGGRQFAALYDNNTFMAYNPFNDELEECEEVTHWQPLPAPPSTE